MASSQWWSHGVAKRSALRNLYQIVYTTLQLNRLCKHVLLYSLGKILYTWASVYQ